MSSVTQTHSIELKGPDLHGSVVVIKGTSFQECLERASFIEIRAPEVNYTEMSIAADISNEDEHDSQIDDNDLYNELAVEPATQNTALVSGIDQSTDDNLEDEQADGDEYDYYTVEELMPYFRDIEDDPVALETYLQSIHDIESMTLEGIRAQIKQLKACSPYVKANEKKPRRGRVKREDSSNQKNSILGVGDCTNESSDPLYGVTPEDFKVSSKGSDVVVHLLEKGIPNREECRRVVRHFQGLGEAGIFSEKVGNDKFFENAFDYGLKKFRKAHQ